ncbi:HAD family hydrolase [Candidatus Aenigmatarchaeota archaeon]
MIKNIIFDWAGTLTDALAMFKNICEIMFKKLGKEPISSKEIKEEFEMPYMKFWNKYFPNLTKEDQDKMFEEAIHKTKKPTLHKGVKETLLELKKMKINLFIVSADPISRLKKEIEESGLTDMFNKIYSREDGEKDKVISEIIKTNHFNPGETMFVADTCGEVGQGKSVGVKTAGVPLGIQSEKILRKANPDYIIHNMRELIEIVKKENKIY